jgi:hypothetical protein
MRSIARLLPVLLACIGTLGLLASSTTVPRGAAPVLDGTLSPDEWSDALTIDVTAQVRIFLKHADGYLFLGIQATTMGVGSPLLIVGEEIRVLHASAALGTAIYARQGDLWKLRQDFTWQCRSTGFSTYALSERVRFLERNGWLGTIGYLGNPTQFEYQIAWGEGPLALLFLFGEFTNSFQLLSWPLATEDAAQYTELVTGTTPSELCFSVTDWATLERGE